MYKLSDNEIVIRLSDGAFIPTDYANADYQEYVRWLESGNSPALETPVITFEDYERSVQQHMDAEAQVLGYDDIKSAVTYADEPSVPKFQIEGKSFRAWRSLCWGYCYEQLDKVQNNERTVPTVEELVAELPDFVLLQG